MFPTKIYTYTIISCLLAFGLGMFAGVRYVAPELTKHHYHTIVEKPSIVQVQGETKTVTDTQIAYIPKETIIVKHIDPNTGEEVTQTKLEKTDIDAQVGKPEIHVMLNGKELTFQKEDDEQFALEKNKITLTQKNRITFDAKVEGPIIDKTKNWSVGIGYGSNGLAGKIDFPLKKNMGGWVYGDKKIGAVGVEIKF